MFPVECLVTILRDFWLNDFECRKWTVRVSEWGVIPPFCLSLSQLSRSLMVRIHCPLGSTAAFILLQVESFRAARMRMVSAWNVLGTNRNDHFGLAWKSRSYVWLGDKSVFQLIGTESWKSFQVHSVPEINQQYQEIIKNQRRSPVGSTVHSVGRCVSCHFGQLCVVGSSSDDLEMTNYWGAKSFWILMRIWYVL